MGLMWGEGGVGGGGGVAEWPTLRGGSTRMPSQRRDLPLGRLPQRDDAADG